ncbi:regulatory signaling modulator protein AmpE [Agarilytica rhodophyticola]|uniref:regulatory signaling modulator protein AmpE n=1 Tax=Agarilytica rhodophyticola TaxID=1737490 RepID=UPI000B34591F|nr:histidine kinase [Agarilytica rhodophyticola]
MDLFIVVLAILFLQVWGADNPFHKDEWVKRWVEYLDNSFSPGASLLFFLAVGLPILAASLVMYTIATVSYWPLLPISVFILLYSFGRGEFTNIVTEYTQACFDEDWDSALERAGKLDVDLTGLAPNDWDTLHQHVLDEAAYRGFERMFAVLFWFFIFGPLGALLYRLVFLFNHGANGENKSAKKWLWVLEWPAVRVLGLSFAMTGNFVGCIRRWHDSLFCVTRPTHMTIGQSVLGALSIEDDLDQTCEVTRKELSLLDKLYLRTLWFWLGAIAVFILVS